jgi:hypothetical protein
MKITITAIAATFSLLMLFAPGPASAAIGIPQPSAIEQVGYNQSGIINAGYWHGAACRDRRFRRHHHWICW